MHAVVPVVLSLVAVVAPTAPYALSLEQYFFELSDRERGAYVTGFLDFFVRDSAREAGYRECVEKLGPARLHQALADLVRSEPGFLSYDAMSWLLYEASRLCNQKGPRERPAAPAPAAVPDPVQALPPSPVEPPSVVADKRDGSATAAILGGLAVLCAGAAAGLLLRRRLPALPFRLRRRDRRRNAHSPG